MNAARVIDLQSASPMFSPLHLSSWHRWLARSTLLSLNFWAVSQFLKCRKGEIPVIHQIQRLQASLAMDEEKKLVPFSLCIHLHNFWVQYGPLWDNVHLFLQESHPSWLSIIFEGTCQWQKELQLLKNDHNDHCNYFNKTDSGLSSLHCKVV